MRGIILATAFCALSTASMAAPPTAGQRMLADRAIVCDTKDQVLDLFSGSKVDEGKGIVPIYQKYQQMKNREGEPTCNMQPVMGPLVKSVQDLGESHGANGDTIHGWLIELSGDSGITGWALYGELVEAAKSGVDI